MTPLTNYAAFTNNLIESILVQAVAFGSYNSRNTLKLHSKKICTKYDKICVFEKSPHENYPREKKSCVE